MRTSSVLTANQQVAQEHRLFLFQEQDIEIYKPTDILHGKHQQSTHFTRPFIQLHRSYL